MAYYSKLGGVKLNFCNTVLGEPLDFDGIAPKQQQVYLALRIREPQPLYLLFITLAFISVTEICLIEKKIVPSFFTFIISFWQKTDF